ncbi:hypothetical protein [Planococcus sp. ISL-110]|uniref:SWIM zinc finger family protein n=1 Tax=Planococcus sp. ISL-110 TaxID=2819167 RepID=UPI001BEC1638|nr:hypothetical protein [Planococcus sp. ISL-110]MBT2570066.1 hypothetical protein [Planococcus sp. ISL-110]
MKLSNLEVYVPTVLYNRGLDYFERDYVEDAPNRWHGLVAGTRDYDVSINLAEDETILSSSCTCPFESDSLCKHEVAVCLSFLAYKEEHAGDVVDILPHLKTLKKAELLEYCRSNVHEIETLYPHLLADYPHEVNEIFTLYIYQSIESASSRKAYQVACGKIRAFQKAMGREAAAGLIGELRFMYPKRKALLDELSKI